MSRVYLYGFAPAGVELPEGGLLGVADEVVERIEVDDFAAIVSPAPESEFGDEALERNSADVEWMAEQGLRHEQVVAWFVDHATILPSRLLTLFSTRNAVQTAASERADRITATLDRFASVREWDLKVGYDPDRLEEHLSEVSPEIAALDREIEAATPGKQFLLRKKRKERARVEGRSAARRLARELAADLEPLASDTRRIDPPGDGSPVLLNLALLVSNGDEGAVGDRVEKAKRHLEPVGLTIEFSGPWAPYRFLEDDD